MQCLDWFKVRTVTKLPGTFNSEFWSKLLVQATLDEPAILHASIALSAFHKAAIAHHEAADRAQMERLALHHYAKAIECLQPYFLVKRSSVQVILVACIVFASLECLRGHFVSARMHVQNGLNIIKREQLEEETQDAAGRLLYPPSLIDDWIIETLSRLHLQSTLIQQGGSQHLFFQINGRSIVPRKLSSLKSSWESLDYLINKVWRLTHAFKANKKPESYSSLHASLIQQRHEALTDLKRWHNAYRASTQVILRYIRPADADKVAAILEIYHTMATIMAEVCMCSDDEMVFDSQARRFSHLVGQLQRLFDISQVELRSHMSQHEFMRDLNMTSTVMDFGCLAPLYYVALKCRTRCLRHRAVMLLETVFHREGLWDSKTTALIARKVVELEEGKFYHECECTAAPIGKLNTYRESRSVPDLPEDHRVGEIEVQLSGNPTERIYLWGRLPSSSNIKSCIAEYDAKSEIWIVR